jgi:hypothetical protein
MSTSLIHCRVEVPTFNSKGRVKLQNKIYQDQRHQNYDVSS